MCPLSKSLLLDEFELVWHFGQQQRPLMTFVSIPYPVWEQVDLGSGCVLSDRGSKQIQGQDLYYFLSICPCFVFVDMVSC